MKNILNIIKGIGISMREFFVEMFTYYRELGEKEEELVNEAKRLTINND